MIKQTKRQQNNGQATFEYIVVTLALVAALLVPLPNENQNLAEKLIAAIKQEYQAYKYAHSVGSLPLY